MNFYQLKYSTYNEVKNFFRLTFLSSKRSLTEQFRRYSFPGKFLKVRLHPRKHFSLILHIDLLVSTESVVAFVLNGIQKIREEWSK